MSTRMRGRMAASAIVGAVLAIACAQSSPAGAPQPPPQQPAAQQPAQPPPQQTPAQQTPAQQSGSKPIAVNEDARVAAEFTKRVNEYVELHKKLEAQLPSLSKEATPTEIDKHQRALGVLIEKARPKAQPGDVFGKETRAYFRRQIDGALKGKDGRDVRAAIMDENPGAIKLRVNGRYPDTVPLSTMPPPLLLALPKLPNEEVEYRFIGERLILLDVHAHIVVDYIEDALPK